MSYPQLGFCAECLLGNDFRPRQYIQATVLFEGTGYCGECYGMKRTQLPEVPQKVTINE